MIEKCELTEKNFELLVPRIQEALASISKRTIVDALFADEPMIVTGTGGSFASAYFAGQVLREANDPLVITMEPREVQFTNLMPYKHLLAITYNNRNHGIDEAVKRAKNWGMHTIALTSSSQGAADELLHYNQDKEKSFISIAATLTPMAIMLKYFEGEDSTIISDILKKEYYFGVKPVNHVVEIIGGDFTNTAAHILESTIAESGLAIPVIHEKYNYCHGRSTMAYQQKHTCVYLLNGEPSELDQLLIRELPEYYQQFIVLRSDFRNCDYLYGEFELAYQALLFCRELSQVQNQSLSHVEYSPVVRKLYKFKGVL